MGFIVRPISTAFLSKEHVKFIVAIKTSNTFARKAIDTVYDNFRSFENFDEQHELYATTVLTEWDYQQEHPYKKDVLTDKKSICSHIHFNIDMFPKDEINCYRKVVAMRKEILNGKRVPEHERSYKKYFQIKETLIRSLWVSSEKSLDGKLFVGFVALFYLSYLKKHMQEAGIFQNYTIQSLLDKL